MLGLIFQRQFFEVSHETALPLQRLMHLFKLNAHLSKPYLRLTHPIVPGSHSRLFILLAVFHLSFHPL